mgnify:CR=1 FL=1
MTSSMIFNKNVVLELSFLNVAIGENSLRLPMKPVYLKFTLFKSPIRNESPVSIQFVGTRLQRNQFTFKQAIRPSLVAFANDASLAEVCSVFDCSDFFYTLYSEVFIKF